MLRKTTNWLFSSHSFKARLREEISRTAALPLNLPREFSIPCDTNQTITPCERSKDSPVFITARFRSGSTLLWKLLRSHPNTTAYYEPLNPRKWFEPSSRGERVDQTHQGVEDYWVEYDRFKNHELDWDDRWSSEQLYVSPLIPNHDLFRYIDTLAKAADGVPILQFNRMDFRLAWLRRRFPNAFLVHLRRNPRDQWISTISKDQPISCSATMSDRKTWSDFYLRQWSRDLAGTIPLLGEVEHLHPYELSYLVWQLSSNVGQHFADYTLDYETLVEEPSNTLSQLHQALNLSSHANDEIIRDVNTRSVDRWQQYADEAWFHEKETRCREMLQMFVYSAVSNCKCLDQTVTRTRPSQAV